MTVSTENPHVQTSQIRLLIQIWSQPHNHKDTLITLSNTKAATFSGMYFVILVECIFKVTPPNTAHAPTSKPGNFILLFNLENFFKNLKNPI